MHRGPCMAARMPLTDATSSSTLGEPRRESLSALVVCSGVGVRGKHELPCMAVVRGLGFPDRKARSANMGQHRFKGGRKP